MVVLGNRYIAKEPASFCSLEGTSLEGGGKAFLAEISQTLEAWSEGQGGGGKGRLYFDSILSRDYPVVLALSLLGAVATLVVTLAADIAYALADPRVRDGSSP